MERKGFDMRNMSEKKMLDSGGEFPTRLEIDESIDKIIQAAFSTRKSAFTYIREICNQVGMDFLLHDIHYMIGIVLLLYLIGGIAVTGQDVENVFSVSTVVMMLTPIAFQLPLFLFLKNEKDIRMMELQMTCKYTLYHILVLKMLLVSVIAVVMNLGWCVLMLRNAGLGQAVHLFLMAVTALGSYSVCCLLLLNRSTGTKGQLTLFVIWILLNAGLKLWVPDIYQWLAFELPILYHLAIWILLVSMGSRLIINCFEIGDRGFVSC